MADLAENRQTSSGVTFNMRCVPFLVCVLCLTRTNAEDKPYSFVWTSVRDPADSDACQAERKLCESNRVQDLKDVHCPRYITPLINGPVYKVGDSALSAEASWHQKNMEPHCSRLESPKPTGCYANGWAAPHNNQNPNIWIQVDLGALFEVWMIATQGRGYDSHNQRVTSYKLASSMFNNRAIKFYKNGKVFPGNTGSTETVVSNTLRPPLEGRFIRLYPVTYNSHRTLRWELYGRKKTCLAMPVV